MIDGKVSDQTRTEEKKVQSGRGQAPFPTLSSSNDNIFQTVLCCFPNLDRRLRLPYRGYTAAGLTNEHAVTFDSPASVAYR